MNFARHGLVVGIVVCSSAMHLHGQCDVSWDGDDSSNNFAEPTNWDGDIVPGSGDTVCHDTGTDVIIVNVGTPGVPHEVESFRGDGGSNRGLTVGDSAARGLKVLMDFIGAVAQSGGAYDVTVASESLLWIVGAMEQVNLTVEEGSTTDVTELLVDGDFVTALETSMDVQGATSGTSATTRVAIAGRVTDADDNPSSLDPFVLAAESPTVEVSIGAVVHDMATEPLQDDTARYVFNHGAQVEVQTYVVGGEWLIGESSDGGDTLLEIAASPNAGELEGAHLVTEGTWRITNATVTLACAPEAGFATTFGDFELDDGAIMTAPDVFDFGTWRIAGGSRLTGLMFEDNGPNSLCHGVTSQLFSNEGVWIVDDAEIATTGQIWNGVWELRNGARVGLPLVDNNHGNPSVPHNVLLEHFTVSGGSVLTTGSFSTNLTPPARLTVDASRVEVMGTADFSELTSSFALLGGMTDESLHGVDDFSATLAR